MFPHLPYVTRALETVIKEIKPEIKALHETKHPLLG